ncbi:epoxide hydrolase family protein [Micromonospora sp. NPDC003241]
MTPKPFAFKVSDSALDDLRRRLSLTRWPTVIPAPAWSAGTDMTTLKRLVAYWADGFDWRSQEAAINKLPQFTVQVGAEPVHYLHLRGEGNNPRPIVLTHGWPSSFLELTKLADRLAQPSRYGGDATDSFDVVVPSLPGFAFSPQRSDNAQTHDLWHRLMTDVLGYQQYGAHGGDLGAGVTTRLARAYPDSLTGIHLLAIANPPDVPVDQQSPEEQQFLAQAAQWERDEGGYEHQQSTRPMTLAYGLSDSPTGVLAWIVEKYRAWSDCDGDLHTRFTDDDMLTQASLYWHTGTIATSFRPYFDHRPDWRRVEVPTAVAVFPHDLVRPPQSWAQRSYHLTRYTPMPRGGHFAAHEEPALLANDITAFFRETHLR